MRVISRRNRIKIRLIVSVLFVFFGLICYQVKAFESKNKQGLTQEPGITSTEMPKQLDGVGITEQLGIPVDLNLKFIDENNQPVSLAKYYDGVHPVVISMIYFACPGLCNFHLNGVIDSLKPMDWSAGQKFQYLAISFDSKENAQTASLKKASYMKVYNRPGTENGWHFLTADEETLKKLTASLGFKYKWNAETNEWAHASAAIVTTPKGIISRYLHGIQIETETFRMALNEATQGKIGTFVDKMVWYCFQYDPQKSKYTIYAFRLVQLGGILIILVLGLMLIPNWWRNRQLRIKSTTEKLS